MNGDFDDKLDDLLNQWQREELSKLPAQSKKEQLKKESDLDFDELNSFVLNKKYANEYNIPLSLTPIEQLSKMATTIPF